MVKVENVNTILKRINKVKHDNRESGNSHKPNCTVERILKSLNKS